MFEGNQQEHQSHFGGPNSCLDTLPSEYFQRAQRSERERERDSQREREREKKNKKRKKQLLQILPCLQPVVSFGMSKTTGPSTARESCKTRSMTLVRIPVGRSHHKLSSRLAGLRDEGGRSTRNPLSSPRSGASNRNSTMTSVTILPVCQFRLALFPFNQQNVSLARLEVSTKQNSICLKQSANRRIGSLESQVAVCQIKHFTPRMMRSTEPIWRKQAEQEFDSMCSVATMDQNPQGSKEQLTF